MTTRIGTVLVVALLTACGTDDRASHASLELSFPGAVGGVVPFKAGALLEFDVRGSAPGLCSSARALVEVVAPPSTSPSSTAIVTLRPTSGCTLEGRGALAWPESPEVTLKASIGSDSVLGTVQRGPGGPLELNLFATPAKLPVAGGIVLVTVETLVAGQRLQGVPVIIQTLPTGVSVLPASFASDESGSGVVSLLVPAGVPELRVDALSGSTRRGITLAP